MKYQIIQLYLLSSVCYRLQHIFFIHESPEVRRAPKSAKVLQSQYVVDEGKQNKSSGNVLVFKYYNQHMQISLTFRIGFKNDINFKINMK